MTRDRIESTGDHSTPAVMASHSWHPVPFLIRGDNVRVDAANRFNELECSRGGLGTFPAKEALPLAFAHAGRLIAEGRAAVMLQPQDPP